MSDNQIDHEAVRLRIEKRLAPRLRLMRRRLWLFANILLFITVMFVFASDHTNSIFYYATTVTVDKTAYLDSHGVPVMQPAWSYVQWQSYPFANVAMLVWFLLVVIHALYLWTAFRREALIEREMDREIELEGLRLQVQLAREKRLEPYDVIDKPKRTVQLSDDGEIIFEDDPVQRKASRRRV